MELSTDQKRAIAESAIVHAAIKLGIGMFRPVSGGERYDLIFDLGERLERVQGKCAPMRGEVLVIRAYSTRRTAYGVRRRLYAAGEIDGLAAYSPDLDRCFHLPAIRVVGRREVSLRVTRSRNNLRATHQLGRRLRLDRLRFELPGAVAQLGERSDGIRKVRGSIPLGSIASERP
jgi:PD-(D/E)XK endonuclease